MLESLENRVLLSGETGLRADYFNASTDLFNAQNASVGALPAVTETDQTVNFNWGRLLRLFPESTPAPSKSAGADRSFPRLPEATPSAFRPTPPCVST